MPARVILQDFTGVPAVVDLAGLRSAMARLGGDPKKDQPVSSRRSRYRSFGGSRPIRFCIRPDVQLTVEFERNGERYEFLKWGQEAFENFRVVPPATGIVHQSELRTPADVAMGDDVLYPDSLVGTDSHTTMIYGLGVVGWSVASKQKRVMLGQPIYMLTPDVVGFKSTGKLPEGATATDLVLTVTQMLRKKGVVNKFVEFYGEGIQQMSLPDRATVANMAPEYGATIGFFPVDAEEWA